MDPITTPVSPEQPGTPPVAPVPATAPGAVPEAKVETPVVKAEKQVDGAKPKSKSSEKILALEAQLAEMQKQLLEQKSAVESDRVSIKTERMDVALERAGILPEYRQFARTHLGDVDVSTDAGKAKIDEFAAQHSAMTGRAKTSTADPISAWATKAQAKPGTLAASMPRQVLVNALTNAVQIGTEE